MHHGIHATGTSIYDPSSGVGGLSGTMGINFISNISFVPVIPVEVVPLVAVPTAPPAEVVPPTVAAAATAAGFMARKTPAPTPPITAMPPITAPAMIGTDDSCSVEGVCASEEEGGSVFAKADVAWLFAADVVNKKNDDSDV